MDAYRPRLDFLRIYERQSGRSGVVEICADYNVGITQDLMIQGGEFYAIWDEENGQWSTEYHRAIALIDQELSRYADQFRKNSDAPFRVLYLKHASTRAVDEWNKYCKGQQAKNWFKDLDAELTFSNTPTSRERYASRKLPYPLADGTPAAWNELTSVLYSPEELHKIEWAIGSIVNGDSKKIQKFLVLYGAAGTGKGTILEIIKKLFDGYYCVFDAKSLGSSSAQFSMEPFKNNPLVALQMDGDLSKIEDNTRINSIVSHEEQIINTKNKSLYPMAIRSFIFMGTNSAVKITDSNSGLIRRLIDVQPTGNKVSPDDYERLMGQIKYELGAIASKCKRVYEANKRAYDHYIPVKMLRISNEFFNFVDDKWYEFKKADGISADAAWDMYQAYCEQMKITPKKKGVFREELKGYFKNFEEIHKTNDGSKVRNWYSEFDFDKYEKNSKIHELPQQTPPVSTAESSNKWIQLKKQKSVLDDILKEYPAQYSNSEGAPIRSWNNVETTLSNIDTSVEHYVRPPLNMIVIDFDIQDEEGNKLRDQNIEEASKWPPTYAELSKSGNGVHLHYIYAGDPTELKNRIGKYVEVKVFTGKSSLRRRLTECNDLPVACISSGLPFKEAKKLIDLKPIEDEKYLRNVILKTLREKSCGGTKPRIEFIKFLLEEAYNKGYYYDLRNLYGTLIAEASGSTHHAPYCMKLVNNMPLVSKNEVDIPEVFKEDPENVVLKPIIFFDVEVFPNLFVVCWKYAGEGKKVCRMINPTATDIATLIENGRLVGFNNRKYDNHILYGRLNGLNNEQLYILSKRIISGDKTAMFGPAYNLSYTDIYDFSSTKQSLKKFEIELKIHHKELGMDWNSDIPKERWGEVASYCENDVIATEATFNALKSDFLARTMLADVAGMTVNDTTNSLTTRIIFGKERNPQGEFSYRDLAQPVRPRELQSI